jgi:gamma-glutamylcyclotransferase
VAARLSERVGRVPVLGPACIHGRRLECNKHGRDGSGKANLVETPGEMVWGVLYRLSSHQLDALDGFEGGYTRAELEVHAADATHRAWTYVSLRLTEDPRPFDWYKQLMLTGAREHGLPDAWLARLRALPDRRPGPEN